MLLKYKINIKNKLLEEEKQKKEERAKRFGIVTSD